MDLFLPMILFVLGVILVVKGGDFFVDAASWIAERSGIPKIIIGATIVSLATTMPELLVSVMAAVDGKVDMSIGNAVGSVTANIGLIMAMALICMPGVIQRRNYLFKSILMVAAAALITVCGITGAVSLPISVILVLVFAVFMYENVHEARKNIAARKSENEETVPASRKILITNIAKFFIGALCIVVGSQLLVDNGSTLARLVGVPERVIGVTLIAVGTSLPELITTITAIVKKQSSLSIGNILGANIIDLTLIMPLSALISRQALPVSSALARIDLPVCLIVSLIAVVPAMIRSRFSRWQGIVLLSAYAIYIVFTCMAV
ncbi:MAG: calcium/sodium antiporter [Oscillospiraceae bacterium]